ncbi:hypothetical protein [Nocardioides flavus (ex Wang et al. 2016)]|uniref:hypothetical protein n=1 Tax=Nocardioides flavus (ex Wang et al. 2016) TaxID=2058780 RepID=UPI00174A2593|nr:hypothetical protein [Nocardioides flavus (ex Wang et al. 2016)]
MSDLVILAVLLLWFAAWTARDAGRLGARRGAYAPRPPRVRTRRAGVPAAAVPG